MLRLLGLHRVTADIGCLLFGSSPQFLYPVAEFVQQPMQPSKNERHYSDIAIMAIDCYLL